MGAAPSAVAEASTWESPHELNFPDQRLRDRQISELENLGTELKLCSVQQRFHNLFYYDYWFVTDDRLFIDFGRGLQHQEHLNVHRNLEALVKADGGTAKDYVVHHNFRLTNEVKARLVEVCGAYNFSLCLRNSEHLARYIHNGVWLSFQSSPGGVIQNYFTNFDVRNFRDVHNVVPEPLRKCGTVSESLLYPECQRYIHYVKTLYSVNSEGGAESSFNVLFLGPTGCGKSHVINLFFNQEVCETSASALSVTRQVNLIAGKMENSRGEGIDVIAVDTMGLCDSVLSVSQVYDVVKGKVSINFVQLDVVVVICCKRIESEQAKAIKKYLDWLNYSEQPENFVFVYNQAENLTEAEKETNVSQMASALELDNSAGSGPYIYEGDHEREILTRFATGFPPNAPYTSIKGDRKRLMNVIFMPRPNRLKVISVSSCGTR